MLGLLPIEERDRLVRRGRAANAESVEGELCGGWRMGDRRRLDSGGRWLHPTRAIRTDGLVKLRGNGSGTGSTDLDTRERRRVRAHATK